MKKITKKWVFISVAAILSLLIIAPMLINFLISLQPKPWPSLPSYPGAQQLQIQKLSDRRIVTFVSSDNHRKVVLEYGSILREHDWLGSMISVEHPNFYYIDRSKDIKLFGYTFAYNECPAFFLNAVSEEMSNGQTLVTSEITKGPCGWPDQ